MMLHVSCSANFFYSQRNSYTILVRWYDEGYSFATIFFSSVMPLLLAFNISDGVWPPYASQLIFEVYEMADNAHAMRILYNGKVMKLPFCDDKEMCNTEIVKEYIAKFEPESVEKDCMSTLKVWRYEIQELLETRKN